MSDDERIARLSGLAQKAFGRRFDGRIMPLTDGGVDVVTKAGGLLLAIASHERAMDALEAALLVMAGVEASDGQP